MRLKTIIKHFNQRNSGTSITHDLKEKELRDRFVQAFDGGYAQIAPLLQKYFNWHQASYESSPSYSVVCSDNAYVPVDAPVEYKFHIFEKLLFKGLVVRGRLLWIEGLVANADQINLYKFRDNNNTLPFSSFFRRGLLQELECSGILPRGYVGLFDGLWESYPQIHHDITNPYSSTIWGAYHKYPALLWDTSTKQLYLKTLRSILQETAEGLTAFIKGFDFFTITTALDEEFKGLKALPLDFSKPYRTTRFDFSEDLKPYGSLEFSIGVPYWLAVRNSYEAPTPEKIKKWVGSELGLVEFVKSCVWLDKHRSDLAIALEGSEATNWEVLQKDLDLEVFTQDDFTRENIIEPVMCQCFPSQGYDRSEAISRSRLLEVVEMLRDGVIMERLNDVLERLSRPENPN